MFDIGFSEMVVIAVVALIVIGPERLPKVARTLGHLFGRMQRYVNDVKADIAREVELDELRKLKDGIQDAANSIEQSVRNEASSAGAELNSLAVAAVETPSQSVPAAPVAGTGGARPSAQLELGLDANDTAARKQG